jgi:DNA-directed RNA polymerase specialized sigma24 family protein
VYFAAIAIWPQVHRFALKLIGDEVKARDLMLKTIARVSRRRQSGDQIANLERYVLLVYKRLVLAAARRDKRFESIELESHRNQSLYFKALEEIERTILVDELIRRMEPAIAVIFERRILGYSFAEIAQEQKGSAPVLRNKFRRALLRLAHEIDCERRTVTDELNDK